MLNLLEVIFNSIRSSFSLNISRLTSLFFTKSSTLLHATPQSFNGVGSSSPGFRLITFCCTDTLQIILQNSHVCKPHTSFLHIHTIFQLGVRYFRSNPEKVNRIYVVLVKSVQNSTESLKPNLQLVNSFCIKVNGPNLL